MAKKVFEVEATARRVTPDSHDVRVGDEIELRIDKGRGVVVFEPKKPEPVTFVKGPAFDLEVPALATAQKPDRHLFSVCYWHGEGEKKEHEALQMVLIIEP